MTDIVTLEQLDALAERGYDALTVDEMDTAWNGLIASHRALLDERQKIMRCVSNMQEAQVAQDGIAYKVSREGLYGFLEEE